MRGRLRPAQEPSWGQVEMNLDSGWYQQRCMVRIVTEFHVLLVFFKLWGQRGGQPGEGRDSRLPSSEEL
jgi:hypothetical protein